MWNVTARDHPVVTALRDTLNAWCGEVSGAGRLPIGLGRSVAPV
jgi:hypothetical protein